MGGTQLQMSIKAYNWDASPIIYKSSLILTMNSDPDTLNNVLPSYSDFSDPDDDSGSDVLSFDEYDMFGLVDNPDDIVFTCPDLPQVSSFDNIISPNLDPNSDAQASVDDVTFPESESDDEAETSLAGVIKTCPTSTDGSEASSIRLVRH